MRVRVISVIASIFLACGVLLGQYTSQEISGFVKDSSGAVVPSAQVSVRHTATGQARTARSNESGYYVIANLPIGEYEVSAEASGFKKFVKTNVVLTVNAKVAVEVTLEVGNVTESVTVTAEVLQVESSSGEVGRLVTGHQATQMQLNGRNFAQLLALLPGVSTTNRSSFDLFGGYGSNMSAQSVNGSRNYTFSWNIDGADNKDNGGGGNNFVNINPDAIAEFKILTSNYNAEYGQNSGAVINLAMKSGTQAFHGTAYEYVRNDAFDAYAFNALTKQKLRFNNFGWNLGGPIYIPGRFNTSKTKLFFFVGQDYKRLRQGNVSTWNVPPMAIREGDFSSVPAAQRPTDPTTRAPFPGNVIPASRISRNSKRLLDNYPKPNFTGTGGNLVFQTTTPQNVNQYLHKVDYNLSERHQIAVHFLRDTYFSVQNLGSLITYDRPTFGTNASAKWTFVLNPTTVNTVQFTFTGNVILQNNFLPNPIFITDYTRKAHGLTYPMIYGNAQDIPSISVSGYNGLGASARNWNNFNRVFQFKDDFSKITGNHNMKFGALAMRSRKNQDNQPTINGNFGFSTGHALSSGNAYADALLGNFNTYLEADRGREGWFRFTQAEFYGQDNWKVSPRLSLDFGVRYFYMQPQYGSLQNVVVFAPRYFDPSKAMTVLASNGQIVPGSGDPTNGLVLGGTDFPEAAKKRIPEASDPNVKKLFRGLPKEISYTRWGTVAPRLGFAYDLTGRQRTVLRGGYGMFYERIQGNFVFGRINNPPFVREVTVYSANIENPAGGSLRPFPAVLSSYDIDLDIPAVSNYSLGIQHKLLKDTLLDVAYVGSGAWHQYRGVNLNQLREGTLLRNPGVNRDALRPYLGYADITHYVTGSNFNYNSVQVQVKKQMSDGGLLNVAYTWSKAITDASGWSEGPMDSYDFKRERGLADYDRRHIFVFSYIYPLPFWRAQRTWYEKAFGGWQLSGVTTMQSGRPMNLGIQGDRARTGSGGQRPDVVGDWRAAEKSRWQWFNTAAFALPPDGKFGNLGRNVVIGPGTNNWDVSLQKTFRIIERFSTEFRAEFYNAPNHFSYWGVGGTLGTAAFGQVSSASDPRILQLALRTEW
ncbi:MAG: TonB-dependent receptor [Acidobacteriota bacterium]